MLRVTGLRSFLLLALFVLVATKGFALTLPCDHSKAHFEVRLSIDGTAKQSGQSTEGPLCVVVYFNSLRFDTSLTAVTSSKGGPDPTTVMTGKSTPSALVGNPQAKDYIQTYKTTIGDIKSFIQFVDVQVRDANLDELEPNIKTKFDSRLPVSGVSLRTDLNNATYLLGQDTSKLAPTPDEKKELDMLQPIIRVWLDRFAARGMGLDSVNDEILLRSLYLQNDAVCKNIFNASSATKFSTTVSDVVSSLDDTNSKPTSHSVENLIIATCTSPVSLSAGVEFSTIRNQEFGIIKVPGGANNTSISKYGLLTDSVVHPLPIAMVHFRFKEWNEKRWAAHYTFGVSGNIQGQASGGSSVEFLPGFSISFIRTLYITAGVHIGAKSMLAGGVKVGDTAPSDAPATPQVTKSYTSGFGIAVTFNKPPS